MDQNSTMRRSKVSKTPFSISFLIHRILLLSSHRIVSETNLFNNYTTQLRIVSAYFRAKLRSETFLGWSFIRNFECLNRKLGSDQSGSDWSDSDRSGSDRSGSNRSGSNRSGPDWPGSDRAGSDRSGSDRSGFDGWESDRSGSDWSDSEQSGSNRSGSDLPGLDRSGWDRSGLDRLGRIDLGQIDQIQIDQIRIDQIRIDQGSIGSIYMVPRLPNSDAYDTPTGFAVVRTSKW